MRCELIETFAKVQRITIYQEAAPDSVGLSPCRDIDTVLAECRERNTGFPADESILEIGAALGTRGETGCVPIAPGRGTDQAGSAIDLAARLKRIAPTQTIFYKPFLPALTTG